MADFLVDFTGDHKGLSIPKDQWIVYIPLKFQKIFASKASVAWPCLINPSGSKLLNTVALITYILWWSNASKSKLFNFSYTSSYQFNMSCFLSSMFVI